MTDNKGYPPRRVAIEIAEEKISNKNPLQVSLDVDNTVLQRDTLKELKKLNFYLSYIVGFEVDDNSKL